MVGSSKIFYIDRKDGEKKEEKIYCAKTLDFLYTTPLGRLCNFFLCRIPFFSHFLGAWHRRPRSKKMILPFISDYHVDSAEFANSIEEFPSFDAFFTRKLKRDARPLAPGVIMPADGRYLVYQNITTCDGFAIKGEKFTLGKLLNNPSLAKNYENGSMVLVRLCPSDYHRFHFPIPCVPSQPLLINGPLYSVNPIALYMNIEILAENKRMITQLSTEKYGTVLFIEVGATSVGSIHQTFVPNCPVDKGEEKGFFSFGGSSIILLFEKDTIRFADDLLRNSSQQIETLSLFGHPLETALTPAFRRDL